MAAMCLRRELLRLLYCMGSTPSSEGRGRGVKEAVSSKMSS
jgi:hypothetical protein